MKNNGFTLVELLVVVAIVGIFGMVAIPSFSTMIQNNRLTSQTNDFLGSLYFARSEAIKLHDEVVLCRSADGASCNAAPTARWEDGWIVTHELNEVEDDADHNGDGDRVDVIDVVLRVGNALEAENTIHSTLDVITFSRRGMSSAEGSWQLCDWRGVAEAKAIIIRTSGKARVSDTLVDGGALTCS